MIKTSVKIIIGILASVFVASCGTGTSTSLSPNENSIITISAPSSLNTYKINDNVTLVVQNNSEDKIAFPPEGAIRLSMKNDNNWVNIENLMANSVGREIILSSVKQEENSLFITSVFPKVPNTSTVVVRIVITGTDQSSNQKVGSYVDVTLSP